MVVSVRAVGAVAVALLACSSIGGDARPLASGETPVNLGAAVAMEENTPKVGNTAEVENTPKEGRGPGEDEDGVVGRSSADCPRTYFFEPSTHCASGQTCCERGFGTFVYGCCPKANAMCCKGGQTCCPWGWTCTDDGHCSFGGTGGVPYETIPVDFVISH